MPCSKCDDSKQICVVCDNAKPDCSCNDEDIADYLKEERIDAEDFKQFVPCQECYT